MSSEFASFVEPQTFRSRNIVRLPNILDYTLILAPLLGPTLGYKETPFGVQSKYESWQQE